MATFFNDTFIGTSGTDLSGHTSDSGGVWIADSGSMLFNGSNGVYQSGVTGARYLNSATSTNADYSVQATVTVLSGASGYWGLILRGSGSSTATDTRYTLLYSASGGTWQFLKSINGSNTFLGSTYALAITTGSSAIVKAKVFGTSLYAYVNGTQIIQITDAYITNAGSVGLAMTVGASASTGFQTSQMSAMDETSSGGSSLLSLSSPLTYRVFQRTGTTGTIPVSGTHTDTVNRDIEASFNGGPFVTIASAVAPNTVFNGSLVGQTQGSGTLTARLVGNTSQSANVSNVGIGDIYLLIGQSNSVGQGTSAQPYLNATLSGSMFTATYGWASLIDPTGSTTSQTDSALANNSSGAGGSVWPLVGGRLASIAKIPIAFVPCARDGCGLSYTTNTQTWLPIPANHTDRTTLYGSAVYRAGFVGGVKAALWWGGESDAINGRTQAQVTTDLQTLASAVYADLSVPLMACTLNYCTGISASNQNNVNLAITSLWNTGYFKIGPNLSDMTSIDSYHLKTDAQLSTAADRWVMALNNAFYVEANNRPLLSIG